MGVDLINGSRIDQKEPMLVDLMMAQVSTEPRRQCVCIKGNVPGTAAVGFAWILEASSSDGGL